MVCTYERVSNRRYAHTFLTISYEIHVSKKDPAQEHSSILLGRSQAQHMAPRQSYMVDVSEHRKERQAWNRSRRADLPSTYFQRNSHHHTHSGEQRKPSCGPSHLCCNRLSFPCYKYSRLARAIECLTVVYRTVRCSWRWRNTASHLHVITRHASA
jgi:hypothetical protein